MSNIVELELSVAKTLDDIVKLWVEDPDNEAFEDHMGIQYYLSEYVELVLVKRKHDDTPYPNDPNLFKGHFVRGSSIDKTHAEKFFYYSDEVMAELASNVDYPAINNASYIFFLDYRQSLAAHIAKRYLRQKLA